MDYIMEAEMLNYESQIDILKEVAYNSSIDEYSITEGFSIKKAWDAFVKWVKEKVGPIIRAMVNWCKKTINFEDKKDKEAKKNIDFISKHQDQIKNIHVDDNTEKIYFCTFNKSKDNPVLNILVENDINSLKLPLMELKKDSFIFTTITGLTDEKFNEYKEKHIKNQEELDKLKMDSVEDCFCKEAINSKLLTTYPFYIEESIRRVIVDKDNIKASEGILSDINDTYYSIQKVVNDFDKKCGDFQDSKIKNAITYGNMLVKETIDMGTITRTCIEIYKKDKEYQYLFLMQVKILMKDALDRGESVNIPNFS